MNDQEFQRFVAVIVVRSFFILLFGYCTIRSGWGMGSGNLNEGFGYAVLGGIVFAGTAIQRRWDGEWPWVIR